MGDKLIVNNWFLGGLVILCLGLGGIVTLLMQEVVMYFGVEDKRIYDYAALAMYAIGGFVVVWKERKDIKDFKEEEYGN